MLETLGQRIKWIIQEQNLKQVEFAKSLGISANYVYLLTSGKKKRISEPLAKLIEKMYGYPALWILTGQTYRDSDSDARNLQEQTMQQIKQMSYQQLCAVSEFLEAIKKEKEAQQRFKESFASA